VTDDPGTAVTTATGNPVSRLVAPAKLTVSLQVTGVRPDGYHELLAEMVTLSLADELQMDPGGSGLAVEVEPGVRADGLPGPGQNLVERALAATDRRAGVRLTKRIPSGGGLGGGSADAAAVLRWAGCADPGVAVRLGADVPFCLVGGRARVEGVGEVVTPLPFEPREYLLVLPPFGVETARVYRAWDEDPRHEGPNALTAAALAVEPRLAAWRDALGEWSGREPVLAGSGSTWFVERGSAGRAEAGAVDIPHGLRVGTETAALVRARTVPAGWNGD
jgi:4-diphosphocytidyl-2-C-methyl-D-erythritol kinase